MSINFQFSQGRAILQHVERVAEAFPGGPVSARGDGVQFTVPLFGSLHVIAIRKWRRLSETPHISPALTFRPTTLLLDLFPHHAATM